MLLLAVFIMIRKSDVRTCMHCLLDFAFTVYSRNGELEHECIAIGFTVSMLNASAVSFMSDPLSILPPLSSYKMKPTIFTSNSSTCVVVNDHLPVNFLFHFDRS